VAEHESGLILGIHIVGPHATDLISEAVLAIRLGAKVKDLAEMPHPHPTLSEALMEAAMNIEGGAIHVP
jgi:dihydrolipoamide dehydrogenase